MKRICVLLLLTLVTGCGSAAPVSQHPLVTPVHPLEKQGLSHTATGPLPMQAEQKSGSPLQEKDLVVYHGPIEHIFFHPLIAYPNRAFDGDSMSNGYNEWFVTIPEFNKILSSLYEKNFILIDITTLYDTKVVAGKTILVPKELKFPTGKKPLVLSIDDINYYSYMIKNGNVSKLVLDSNGNIATESTADDGSVIISHKNEIVPIVDDFVKNHPDFSFKGAKGILSITGYEGILGYRTNDTTSPSYPSEKQQAMKVVRRLKDTGWTFAAHGYGHLDANQVSYTRLVNDTLRWKKEVEPLVGPTPVYIYPFGSRVPTDSNKFKFLVNEGFDVLCSVGPTPYLSWATSNRQTIALMMDRRHIDGISLITQQKQLSPLFDAQKILDPIRPRLKL